MPSNVVRTKEDERLWEKAKDRAKEEGQAENWAYVMGIFQRMKGNKSAGYVGTYTVTLYDTDDEGFDRDNLRDLMNVLSRYNVVDKSPFEEGTDIIVEVVTPEFSRFRSSLADYASRIEPARLVLRRGDHGSVIRLGSFASKVADVWVAHQLINPANIESAPGFHRKQAYDEKGRDPDAGWTHGQVEPFVKSEGEGSQTPPAHDNQGKPLEVPDLGTLEIPGYKWHGKAPKVASAGDLAEVVEMIRQANDLLRDAADVLDARVDGPSLSDSYREAAHAAQVLRSQVSRDLGTLMSGLRRVSAGSGRTAAGTLRVDLDTMMKELKQTVDDAITGAHAPVEIAVFSALEAGGFDFKAVRVEKSHGWLNVVGAIRDQQTPYRTREEVDAFFKATFDTYGQLSGGAGSWRFTMGGWPSY